MVFDRCLIGSNELIGEADIELNIHNMLKKVVSRQKPVEMKRKIKGDGFETNQIWIEVFNSTVLDPWGKPVPQGKVLLGFEILPEEDAEKIEAGWGRGSPNFNPTLPDPVGRFTFDLFSPLKILKECMGPKRYRKCCITCWCIICAIVLGALLAFVAPNVVGNFFSNLFI